MGEHISYSEALEEVQRLLAGVPAEATTQAGAPREGQLAERLFPAISVRTLREQCGSPDNMLAIACERLMEARTQQGPFARPLIEDAVDLLALCRYWLRAEAWRPIPIELRKAGAQIVTGKRTAFVRQSSKQPARFSLAWWRGGRS